MKTNVILALDTRRVKSDGTCSIILRIVHHRNSSQISTGYSVLEKDWDKKEKRIKNTHKGIESVARLNNIISKKKSEAMDIISKLDEMKTLDSFTVLQLKEIIERKSDKVSFVSYTENLIMEMKKTNRIGNARAYKSALSAVKNFFGDKPISFQEINYPFLLRFESNHLLKGYSLNGLSTYLRTIRAIYNSAIKDGIIEEAIYPFKKYQIKATKTRKRAISIDAIKKIEKLELENKHPLFHTRNYFLISFLCVEYHLLIWRNSNFRIS
jgi:integrase/recombinase XerD